MFFFVLFCHSKHPYGYNVIPRIDMHYTFLITRVNMSDHNQYRARLMELRTRFISPVNWVMRETEQGSV